MTQGEQRLRDVEVIWQNEQRSKIVCVDFACSKDVEMFIGKLPKNKNKFQAALELIVSNNRNTDIYDKEDIDTRSKNVTAIKFKGKLNTRFYCKEYKLSVLYVVICRYIEHKESQGVNRKLRDVIHSVAQMNHKLPTA